MSYPKQFLQRKFIDMVHQYIETIDLLSKVFRNDGFRNVFKNLVKGHQLSTFDHRFYHIIPIISLNHIQRKEFISVKKSSSPFTLVLLSLSVTSYILIRLLSAVADFFCSHFVSFLRTLLPSPLPEFSFFTDLLFPATALNSVAKLSIQKY